MKNINLFDILQLGEYLQILKHYSKGLFSIKVKVKETRSFGLIGTFIRCKNILDRLNICQGVSNEIEDFIVKLRKKYVQSDSSLLSIRKKNQLDKKDRKYLRESFLIRRDRISGKLSELSGFILSNRGILSIKSLEEGAKEFFDEEGWESLKDFTKRDLNSCCKNILFELPTTAGFIALRATENVLRRYYKKKTGKSASERHLPWGKIINELEDTDADENLLNHLDYLRANLRNPLNHPEDSLEQKEAERIFPMVINTIEEMVEDF